MKDQNEQQQNVKKQKRSKKRFKSFKYLVILIIILLLINVYFLVKEFAKFDFIDIMFTENFNKDSDVSPDIEIEDSKEPINENEKQQNEYEENIEKIEAVIITIEYKDTSSDTGKRSFELIFGEKKLDPQNWEKEIEQKIKQYDKNKTKIIKVKNSGNFPQDIIKTISNLNKQNDNLIITLE